MYDLSLALTGPDTNFGEGLRTWSSICQRNFNAFKASKHPIYKNMSDLCTFLKMPPTYRLRYSLPIERVNSGGQNGVAGLSCQHQLLCSLHVADLPHQGVAEYLWLCSDWMYQGIHIYMEQVWKVSKDQADLMVLKVFNPTLTEGGSKWPLLMYTFEVS